MEINNKGLRDLLSELVKNIVLCGYFWNYVAQEREITMQSKSMVSKIVIFLFFSLMISQLFAGAWTQRKNGYYLRIYTTYLFATEEFSYQGENQDLFEEQLAYKDSYFKDIGLIIYSEYGLTNSLTFIGELPF